MATDFSILDWEIPWTEEPGGLQSMESQQVGHDWATNMMGTLTNYTGVTSACLEVLAILHFKCHNTVWGRVGGLILCLFEGLRKQGRERHVAYGVASPTRVRARTLSFQHQTLRSLLNLVNSSLRKQMLLPKYACSFWACAILNSSY